MQTIESIAPILAILVTAVVSIKSIQKTAKANRISIIHNEMLYCLIDSVTYLRKAASLLEDISRKAVYYRIPNNEVVETAFDRYWREIQIISEKFNLIQTKQKFVLPRKLYNKMQKLIDKINEGKNEAKNLQPQNNIYPDTDALEEIVNEINKIYVDFVHSARVFVGVDDLEPLSLKEQPILGTEEIKGEAKMEREDITGKTPTINNSHKDKKIFPVLLPCLFTFVLGLFAVPVQQWILSPRNVKIEFQAEKPFIIKTRTSGRVTNKHYDIYPVRLRIINNSSVMAQNCSVVITKYWHIESNQEEFEEPNFEPLRIGWTQGARVDIGPGMEILAPFMKIAEANYQLENEIGEFGLSGDSNTPQLRLAAPNWPRWMSSHIPAGEHCILVTVYFDNRKPVQQKFKIKWSGKWEDSYEEMLKQIIIEKVDE